MSKMSDAFSIISRPRRPPNVPSRFRQLLTIDLISMQSRPQSPSRFRDITKSLITQFFIFSIFSIFLKFGVPYSNISKKKERKKKTKKNISKMSDDFSIISRPRRPPKVRMYFVQLCTIDFISMQSRPQSPSRFRDMTKTLKAQFFIFLKFGMSYSKISKKKKEKKTTKSMSKMSDAFSIISRPRRPPKVGMSFVQLCTIDFISMQSRPQSPSRFRDMTKTLKSQFLFFQFFWKLGLSYSKIAKYIVNLTNRIAIKTHNFYLFMFHLQSQLRLRSRLRRRS